MFHALERTIVDKIDRKSLSKYKLSTLKMNFGQKNMTLYYVCVTLVLTSSWSSPKEDNLSCPLLPLSQCKRLAGKTGLAWNINPPFVVWLPENRTLLFSSRAQRGTAMCDDQWRHHWSADYVKTCTRSRMRFDHFVNMHLNMKQSEKVFITTSTLHVQGRTWFE